MEANQTCRSCGKSLAGDAPQGLCAECLLKAGLGSGVELGPDTEGPTLAAGFSAPRPEELSRLFPNLEVQAMIGQGGMGAVYRAHQKELDRIVALKILPPDIGRDPAFAERFTREARAMARLNHPGIVTLYEFGRSDGLFFFLMEFVEGVNLRQLLATRRLSPREALAIVPQICDSLQYAHDQGIVHRDIKPENILIDRQGRVKVADFGLAKLVSASAESPTGMVGAPPPSEGLTEVGKVMGTPQYMAPEQRERPREVDHRADIYSLGVVFYQMLTGELPGHELQRPSSRVQVDVRLDEVVLRALEKEPERRYQQASQVKTAVETIAQTSPSRIPPAQPVSERVRRKPLPFARAVVAGASVCVTIIIAVTLVTATIPETYSGVSRVICTPPTNDPYALQTQVEIIRSDPVLSSVVTRLDLRERWGRRYGGERLSTDEALNHLKRHLSVQNLRLTLVLEIRFLSPDRREAAEVANAVAEARRAWRTRNGQVAIIDQAAVPTRPVRPNKPLNVFLGCVAGVFLGLISSGLVLLWGALRPAAHRPDADRPQPAPGRLSPARATAMALLSVCIVAAGAISWAVFPGEPKTNFSPPLAAIRSENVAGTAAEDHSALPASWSEVSECVLPFSAPCAMKYLQFATGDVFEIGDGPGDTSDHADIYRRAEDTGGLDVVVYGGESNIQMVGKGCVFSRGRSTHWETTSAASAVESLKGESWLSGVVEIETKELPLTWLFKTATGQPGMLQLLGVVPETRGHGDLGVKLRYKLVHKDAH